MIFRPDQYIWLRKTLGMKFGIRGEIWLYKQNIVSFQNASIACELSLRRNNHTGRSGVDPGLAVRGKQLQKIGGDSYSLCRFAKE